MTQKVSEEFKKWWDSEHAKQEDGQIETDPAAFWAFKGWAASRRDDADLVNKAWADGKNEGHGDATAEASVVIGKLRARIAELEAERDERAKQGPVAWAVKNGLALDGVEQSEDDAKTVAAELQKSHDLSGSLAAYRVVPLYSAPPATAPVRLTDEDVSALYDEAGFDPQEMREAAEYFARAIESAVLRANGFKVEGGDPTQPALTPEQIEKADEAICEALRDAYDCGRVWFAWSYGTMGPEDFYKVSEDPERVAEIRNAAAAALGFKVD